MVFPGPFFQFGFVGGDEAKRRVEQYRRILRVGVVHRGFLCDGVGMTDDLTDKNRQHKHDDQTDALAEIPMLFFFVFKLLKLGAFRYHSDNQCK